MMELLLIYAPPPHPSKEEEHIALHLSVSMSVCATGMSVSPELLENAFNTMDLKLGTLIYMKMIPITQQISESRSRPFFTLLLRGHLWIFQMNGFILMGTNFHGLSN